MKIARLLFLILFVAGILFAIPVSLYARDQIFPVRVGVYENKPQVYTDEEGAVTGIYIDILKHIAKEEGWTLKFFHGTWEEGLARLKEGKIDIMTSIAYTKSREAYYAFSDETVFVNWGQVFVRDSGIEGFPDLEGKTIAVIKKDIYNSGENGIRDLLQKFDISSSFIEVDDYIDAFIAVEKREADAAVVNRLFGALYKDRFPLRETAMIFHPSEMHFAYPRYSARTGEIKKTIDLHLNRLKSDKSSVYYSTIAHYMNLPSRTVLFSPRAIQVVLVICALVLALLGMVFFMRREIRNQTQQLKENEQRLDMALKGTNAGLWDWDMKTNTLTTNNIWSHLLGYDPEELAPFTIETWERLTHPDDLKKAREGLARHFQDGNIPYDLEIRMKHKEGHWVWLMDRGKVVTRDKNGRPLRMIGTHTDISDWKHAEAALLESEQRYRSLFENNHAVMLLLDPEDGRIVEANPAAVGFYGYSKEKLLSMNIDQINILSQDEIKKEMNLARYFKKSFFEFKHRLASGEIRDVEIYSGLVFFENKKLLYSIIHDVTGKKEMEREKERLETQLRRSQRLETIGTLTGGIAHDFNNILLPIIGYTDMALQKITDDKVKGYLSASLAGANRAKELVRQLLTFSRQTEHVKAPVDICEIIHDSVHMLKSLIPSSIEIELDLPQQCKYILADRTQLHQVIVNLCTNAAHAMEESGGTLTLSVCHRLFTTDTQVPVEGIEPGKEYLILTVADTGAGMTEEIMEHIFEPFFTTKSMDKGTGMGLSIVHGIVTSHEGVINVSSKPNHGSTFTLYFPVVDAISPVEKEKMPQARGGSEHLLLVDDEEIITLMLKEALTRLGYRITSFSSSTEALNAFHQDPGRFDLLLTDLTMPDMNGMTLAEHILQRRPELPVIIMTGYGTLPEDQFPSELSRNVIRKPFELYELTELLRTLLADKE